MSNAEWRRMKGEGLRRRFIRSSPFAIRHSRSAFSLVELLTVIFIIALLIGILVPSLTSARNAAKKMTTAKTLDAVKAAMEMFKNDNGKDFPQTNGYPPSFAHPPIVGFNFKPELGEFPFLEGKPAVTGAHFLPALLIGLDKNGYIKRSSVPASLRDKPNKWYVPDPLADGKTVMERSPLYLDPSGAKLLETRKLPGRANTALFTSWGDDDFQNLPVIVDAFDQPILYYAANSHGKPTNMVEDKRYVNNEYVGGTGSQAQGPPFYFHQDNLPFTGGPTDSEADRGWDLGNIGKGHPIAESGSDWKPADFFSQAKSGHLPFAKYILDRKIYSDLAKQTAPPDTAPLRPVNADSYLLISAGVDGRFGTSDDVTNFPPLPEL